MHLQITLNYTIKAKAKAIFQCLGFQNHEIQLHLMVAIPISLQQS